MVCEGTMAFSFTNESKKDLNSYVHTVKNYDPNKVIDYDVGLM